MTLSTFPTFSDLRFGSCRLAAVRDREDSRPGYPSVAGQRAAFFRGTYARKVRKVRKGGRCHDAGHLSDLPDLSGAEAMSSAVGSAPWQGLKISSCLRRGPVRRQAFGPDGDGLGDFD